MFMSKQHIPEAYLRHLSVLYQNVPVEDRVGLLPALEDELRRHQEFIDCNRTTLTGIAVQVRELKDFLQRTKQKMEDSTPMLNNQLLALFLDNNQQVVLELKAKKEELLLEPSSFREFLTSSLNRLRKFIEPIAEYAIQGVACEFHSFIMQCLSLRDFQACHRVYERSDKLLVDLADKATSIMCLSRAPPRVKALFDFPVLFTFAIGALRKAVVVEIPLEAMSEIARALELINEMYQLEVGGVPQPDDTGRLLNYALLQSRIRNLFTMGKFIQQFLADLEQTEVELIDDKMKAALAQYVKNNAMIEQFLSDY
jgi:hypothetical protein